MKKIISAFALGAMVVGAASADVKFNLNYRTGAELVRYANGENDKGFKTGSTTTWFDLTKHNTGKDSLTIAASGDVISAKVILQPTQDSDNVVFHTVDVAAKYGNLKLEAGWNGDGLMIGSYRVKNAADAGNEEGGYFERFKLGSIFKGSYALIADNPIALSNTDRSIFGLASYKIDATDDLSITVQGAVIADRKWTGSGAAEQNQGNKGFSLMVNPRLNGLLDACLIFKGSNDLDKTTSEKRTNADGSEDTKHIKYSEYTFGAWFQPLMVQGLNAVVGFSGAYVDQTLTDFGFDLRARYTIDNLEIGTMNNLSIAKSKTNGDDFADADEGLELSATMGNKLEAMKSTMAMWNMIYARYKINNTVSAVLSAGLLSDLDNNKDDTSDGMQIVVHPHAQIYANKGASVVAGVAFAKSGIGADDGKVSSMYVSVPVLFRVKM